MLKLHVTTLQISLIMALNLLIFSGINAQISEESRSMSLGVRNALVLDIPDTEVNFVEKLWKKYVKTYGGKTKKVRSSNEIFTDNADVVALGGANSVDLYARVEEEGSGSSLAMWVDLGGAFLTSDTHSDRYIEGEKFLMRFALFVAKENTRIELEEEKTQLKKLESSLKRLVRENERYHREIEQAKEAIRRAEANIETNLLEQEQSNQQIETQLGVVEDVKRRLEELD